MAITDIDDLTRPLSDLVGEQGEKAAKRKKQLAEYVREENEKLAYKGLTESDLKRLINSRAKKLEMSVSEYKRLKFDNPFVKELNKRKGK